MNRSAFILHPGAIRRLLAGSAASTSLGGQLFRSQSRRFTVAQVLVRAFYGFLLYTAVGTFPELAGLLDHAPTSALWPDAWLTHIGSVTGPRVLVAFYLATNILGAFVAPWRAGRILTFLGLLEFVAYQNSFGKIGHSQHLLLYVAAILVLLPSGWDRPAPQTSRRRRQETLLIFWLAQASILLSYTMSGVAKFGAALYQLVTAQPNAFTPGGLSAIVAQRLVETHSNSLFGAWIVHHPYLTWPALPVAIYLESCAFLVAFRPALARPWAALLIVFHVSTYFTMTISFPQNCFLLAAFFLASPFEPEPAGTWQMRLLAVPLGAHLYKIAQTRQRPRGV